MQSNYDGSMHRRNKVTKEFFELWPSESRTWGHRSGSLGQIDNMCKYFALHSGAKTLELYEIILNKFCDYLRHTTRLIATRYFDSTIYGSKEPDKMLMHIPRNHDSFPWSIHKHIILIRLFITDKHKEEQLDYIQESTNKTTRLLHTPSGTV
jgi:hypothetical protein